MVSRGGVELPVPRVALPSIGIPPGVPPGPLAATAGAALPLMPGSAEPTWLNEGAAEVQLCGTESMPSEAARPTLALTVLLIPGAPKTPVPEPKPLPSVYPNGWNWLPKTLATGLIDMPELDIDPDEPIPDTRDIPDVSPLDDDIRLVNDDSGDVDDEDDIDEAVEANPCTRLGAVAVVSWVDSIEVIWVDITELSWLPSRELIWLPSRELICDAV